MTPEQVLLLQVLMGLFLGTSTVLCAEGIRELLTSTNAKEPHMETTISIQTGSLDLVYRDENGDLHTQSWEDLTSSGTLIDPETGDGMELVGWSTPDL